MMVFVAGAALTVLVFVGAERANGAGSLGGMVSLLCLSLVLVGWLITLRRREAVIQETVVQRTAELRDNHERLQTILDTIHSGVIVTDLDDYRIVDANPAALALLGLPRADLVGSLCHESTCQKAPDSCPLQDGSGPQNRIESEVQSLGGGFPVLKNTQSMRLQGHRYCVSSLLNLSPVTRAEQSRSLLLSAIEQAQEAVVITDTEGTILYVNPAFEESSGYSPAEAVGQTSSFLNSGEHDDEFFTEIWDTIIGGGTWCGEITNRHKDGSLYVEYITISPMRNPAGEIVNFVALKLDLSEVRWLEGQVHQLQKMEAIGRLAGGVAHDFNNLLQSIFGYTALALETLPEEGEAAECLGEVNKAGRRAAELVHQILSLSRRSDPQVRPLKVHLGIEEAFKLLGPALPATISVELDVDPACGAVSADETQLQQIVMNLCTNARDAIDGRPGTIEVGLHEALVDATLAGRLPGLEPGRYALLTLRDTGHGMDEETLQRAFDPYFTTKVKGEGTGLGLSVVHGIVQGWGGGIDVASTPGEGTEFRIYLPLCLEEATPSEEIPSIIPEAPAEARVLLVDDEPMIIRYLSVTLNRLGYQVDDHTDSVKAYKAFLKNPGGYDVVATDQEMPAMSGVELSHRLLEARPDLPILLYTGYSDTVDRKLVKQVGIRAFLLKPFEAEELDRTLREIMG